MAETAPPTLVVSTAVNENDHGARIVVIAVLCLVASGMSVLTRLVIRWPWKALFGVDDAICMAAMAASIVQTGVLLKAVERGLGQKVSTLDLDSIETIQQLVYGCDLVYIVALSLSKLAVATLFRRLSPSRGANAMSTLAVIWGTASLLALAIREPFSHPWDIAKHASNNNVRLFVRWAAIEGLGIGVDLALIIFPTCLLWSLRMRKDTKISILLGFALLRFPVIVLAALRIVAMSKMDWLDASLTYVNPEIYGQLEMHLNVITATVPCLRIFLRGWNTGSLGLTLEDLDREEWARHSQHTRSKNGTGQTISSGGSKRYLPDPKHRHREMSETAEVFKSQSVGHTESTISSQRRQSQVQRSASIDSQHAILIQRSVDVDSSERIPGA